MKKKAKRTPKATPQDAELILKLYDLRREATMRKGRDFMLIQFWPQNYDEFKAVATNLGSEQNALFRMAWTYWDMACAMVLSGAINEDLFYKCCGEAYFLYAKFKQFIEPLRKEVNNPDFMANIEEMATKSPEARQRVKRIEERIRTRLAPAAAKARGAA
jgi:hypothetical protein